MKLSHPESVAPFRSLALKLISIVVIVGVLVRTALIITMTEPVSAISFLSYLNIYLLGAVNDCCFGVIALCPLWLFMMLATPVKYCSWRPYVIISVAALLLLGVGVISHHLRDFNRGLNTVFIVVMSLFLLCYCLKLFIPKIRDGWTKTWFVAIISIYTIVIYWNASCEFIFWQEFQVRYNFIAVDYLVYTSEVIGNIIESYPLVLPVIILLLVSALTVFFIFRKDITGFRRLYVKGWRLISAAIYIPLFIICCLILNFNNRFQQTASSYVNELQANGPFRFFEAFQKNELDFEKFYPTLPAVEAQAIVDSLLTSNDADSIAPLPGLPNIVLITMESMSAGFMQRYGCLDSLTPNLDSLTAISLTFDRCIAAGNRTVRGLEALTLSRPPSPGQSIVKRADNRAAHSIGKSLRENGYQTFFLYGGDSYFDNMGDFFANNGYTVVDRDEFADDEVTFENVWGVADEDAFNKAISLMNSRSGSAAPAFIHIMTISNHRPYTYPENRIDVPPSEKSRRGALKYADFAIGDFVRKATATPWGKNTLFVIVADHCASSAGSTELPLDKYHIPAMIHAPEFVAPQSVTKTISQIDVMPTVLSIIGLAADDAFYGKNILSDSFDERAFLATYQDLGYLKNDTLTVLSPKNRVRQYVIEPSDPRGFSTVPAAAPSAALSREATAVYQLSSTSDIRK